MKEFRKLIQFEFINVNQFVFSFHIKKLIILNDKYPHFLKLVILNFKKEKQLIFCSSRTIALSHYVTF